MTTAELWMAIVVTVMMTVVSGFAVVAAIDLIRSWKKRDD